MSSVKHRMREARQVVGSGEQTGVAGNTAQHGRIFVLNFPLDNFLTKDAVVGRGRDFSASARRGIESCIYHRKRLENFTPAESVKRFVRDAFQRGSQQNKSDIAVFDTLAGVC